jgi:hypothetical protein
MDEVRRHLDKTCFTSMGKADDGAVFYCVRVLTSDA